ncbi:MAG: ATP synthase F1 subunit gamma [Desulfarculus sp.]|nr:ATP synthase F1 subunit gamma [Pseudomonadota bacterium]MBU4599669.1 ATP synthase F1 subunit gamma [Pseudomonadota bacterium]MBV1715058.1 ATP synthase F1 subunit gamma [Desulfarculus sp.]MBV1739898.1 ATP synthase F1 subunit gamma [Desulfarculus sp.]MBV1752478.1 ATP synthase F1 subunit gamma [Desulfarculus sp.]
MAALRDIQNKIAAVKKTRQITRAMNMVAAARLRQVQERTERFRPYAAKFSEVLGSLSEGIDQEAHPLLAQPEQVSRVALILITADRGLCGSFNMNLILQAQKFMTQQKSEGREVAFYAVGRKGMEFFARRKVEFAQKLPGVMNVVDFDLATQVARLGLNAFLSGEVQEVYLLYSRFRSIVSQIPTVEKLLPISPEATGDEDESSQEYLTEPSAEEILVDLLPRYLNVRVYSGLLETSTSENAARMAAMDNATKNCKDLIQNLTLAFNKARQAAITTELMDIVGGAEALKAG